MPGDTWPTEAPGKARSPHHVSRDLARTLHLTDEATEIGVCTHTAGTLPLRSRGRLGLPSKKAGPRRVQAPQGLTHTTIPAPPPATRCTLHAPHAPQHAPLQAPVWAIVLPPPFVATPVSPPPGSLL